MTCTSSLDDFEIHIIAGDFTGHVGKESGTLDTYHSSKGHGTRNPEGLRLLDLCSETDLAISNTFFDKNQDKLVTFSAANNNTD